MRINSGCGNLDLVRFLFRSADYDTDWALFFKSSWVRFETRFEGILGDLARRSELVGKEANSLAIAQANE